ncbi:MAG TPA: hypothetical protein VNU92_02920 [Edaphobacter sp.]|nr:hypothetical protein [Edaphobacter sp.]
MMKEKRRGNDASSDETVQQERASKVEAEFLLLGVVVVAQLEFGGDDRLLTAASAAG